MCLLHGPVCCVQIFSISLLAIVFTLWGRPVPDPSLLLNTLHVGLSLACELVVKAETESCCFGSSLNVV